MARHTKIFPKKDGSFRSKPFKVPCGSYAKITGYDLCPGICVRVSEVHQNACTCDYSEKPYCLLGDQIGIDDETCQAIIPMPGTYVLTVCTDDESLYNDIEVYVEVCTNLENVQTVVAAAGVQA